MTKQEQILFIQDNYPLTTNHTSNRRIRHTFFENIQTEIQAYLLGFYAADGNINELRKTLRVHLQKQDSDIVYLFKDFISPDARTFIKPEKLQLMNLLVLISHLLRYVNLQQNQVLDIKKVMKSYIFQIQMNL